MWRTPQWCRFCVQQNTGSAPPPFTVSAVHFANDTQLTSNSLIASDSKIGLGSIWVDTEGPSVWSTTPGGFWTITVSITTAIEVVCDFWDTSNTLEFTFSNRGNGPPATAGWHSVIWSVDTNHAAGQKIGQIAIDGVLQTVTSSVDASPAFNIGWSQDAAGTIQPGNLNVPFDLSECYVAMGQYLDLSNAANVAKFVDGSNKPVSLGANGATPTGTSPTIYFSGDATHYAQPNLGTGGTFTITGTPLTNASTHP